MHSNFHSKYRPDIDGIRAIAILPVVAFHAFPTLIKGGFVGVDIFFVISGFLISNILFKSMDRGDFSFIDFYVRRIKRIFPALVLVLVACFVFGWFALLPNEYKELGKHISGGAGFVSNFVLNQEAGYFDTAAGLKPLLHLWSLGIEEQFYIVWPLLVFLAWKRKFNFFGFTVAILITSFAFNLTVAHRLPTTAFYNPISRFWELLTGGVLAYVVLASHKVKTTSHSIRTMPHRFIIDFITHDSPLLNNAKSIMGLLLIVIAVFVLDKNKVFPGYWALLPTIGTLLLISAGANAWLNRNMLSQPALVFIGTISYPLYLWHWPLLSFARIIEYGKPSQEIIIVAFLLSFGLAWLTYVLVEKPVRFGSPTVLKPIILCISMAVIGYAGFYTFKHNGLDFRSKGLKEITAMQQMFEWDDATYNRSDACIKKYGGDQYCLMTNENASPTVALIGDSHANHFFWGLSEYYKRKDENLLNLGVGGCPPFLNVDIEGAPTVTERHCYERSNRLYSEVLTSATIKTVVFSFDHSFYLGDDINYIFEDDSTPNKKGYAGAVKAYSDTIASFIRRGKKVVIIYDLPDLGFDPKICFIPRPFSISNRGLISCTIPTSVVNEQFLIYDKLIRSMKESYPTIVVFRTHHFICDKSNCYASEMHLPLYRDSTHLSFFGSNWFSNKYDF